MTVDLERRLPMISLMKHAWLRFARLLAVVHTRLLLTLVFILVIVPLGIVFRMTGRTIARVPEGESLWTPIRPGAGPEKPF